MVLLPKQNFAIAKETIISSNQLQLIIFFPALPNAAHLVLFTFGHVLYVFLN